MKLESLGPLIKIRRGNNDLRKIASAIGIGSATLMRIEKGQIPSIETFSKICRWLKKYPGDFLGFNAAQKKSENLIEFKIDQINKDETIAMIAQMLNTAAKIENMSKLIRNA